MITTTTVPAREHVVERPVSRRRRRQLLRHFLEMVLAMAAGMMVVGGLVSAGIRLVGVDDSGIGPEASVLLMAFNMSVGMTLWMRYRGHQWPAILEMDGAMFAPFAAILPLLWMDLISEDAMYVLGHVLMLPAMLAVVLHRQEHTDA